MSIRTHAFCTVLAATLAAVSPVLAQQGGSAPTSTAKPGGTRVNATEAPADYTIGAGDVLTVNFWREAEISGEVVVRPDGKITLPLIKDVAAAGLTPKQLEDELERVAQQYVKEPNATVSVRTINSRQVYITGNIARPGAYGLIGPTTVLQFLAQAGGVLEFADSEKIVIMRTEGGQSYAFKFNYKDIIKQKNLAQNILLKPGDTVIVP